MANDATLAAKLSLNIDGLKKGWDAAEQESAARTGRMTATQKKAAAEQEKIQQKAAAEYKKFAKECEDADKAAAAAKLQELAKVSAEQEAGAKEANSHLASVRNGLLNAGSAGDVLSSVFEAIGSIGGPVGAAAVGSVALIAKGMYEASETARAMHKELGALRNESHGMTSSSASAGDLLGQAGKISESIAATRAAKEEALQRLGILGRPTQNTVSNTVLGSLGEHINDKWQQAWGKPTASDDQAYQQEKLLKERSRLVQEAASASNEDLDAVRDRVKLGERAGALEENRLKTAREIAAVEAELGKAGLNQESIDKVTAPIQHGGNIQGKELNRMADEAARDSKDSVEDAQTQALIAANALRDDINAAEQNVKRLEDLAKKKRAYAAETNHEERKRGYNAEADKLEIQAGAAQVALDEKRRDYNQKILDTQNAIAQSQMAIVSLTAQDVANRAQASILGDRIAANLKKMEYATPAQQLALKAENAELQVQIEKLRILDELKSPKMKAQERAAARAGQRAEARAAAKAADQDHTKKLGGERHRLGDAALKRAMQQEAKAFHDNGIPGRGGVDKPISGKAIGDEIAAAVTAAMGKAKVTITNL